MERRKETKMLKYPSKCWLEVARLGESEVVSSTWKLQSDQRWWCKCEMNWNVLFGSRVLANSNSFSVVCPQQQSHPHPLHGLSLNGMPPSGSVVVICSTSMVDSMLNEGNHAATNMFSFSFSNPQKQADHPLPSWQSWTHWFRHHKGNHAPPSSPPSSPQILRSSQDRKSVV